VAAGRTPEADGGIIVRALDPATGREIWTSSVDTRTVGLCDYVVGGAGKVYVAGCEFDAANGEARLVDREAPHLRGGKVGLLEASWTKMELALRKQIQDWTAQGVSGQILSFTPEQAYGYRLAESGQGEVFAHGENDWVQPLLLPKQVHALVATQGHVVIAGTNDRQHDSEGGFLTLWNGKTGKRAVEISLPAPPVFDGLAVAGGRIYISLQNGELVSWASHGRP
jgi:hypothetical protein